MKAFALLITGRNLVGIVMAKNRENFIKRCEKIGMELKTERIEKNCEQEHEYSKKCENCSCETEFLFIPKDKFEFEEKQCPKFFIGNRVILSPPALLEETGGISLFFAEFDFLCL